MSMERISGVPGVQVWGFLDRFSRAGLLCQQELAARKEFLVELSLNFPQFGSAIQVEPAIGRSFSYGGAMALS
jgi:hypothetical protein